MGRWRDGEMERSRDGEVVGVRTLGGGQVHGRQRWPAGTRKPIVPRRLTIQRRETPRHTKGKKTSRTIVTTPTEGMSTRSELVPWAKLHPRRRVIRGKQAVPIVLHEFMAHPNGAPPTNSALSGGVRPTARPAAAARLTGSVSILTTIEGWLTRFSSSSLHDDSSSAATLGGGRA